MNTGSQAKSHRKLSKKVPVLALLLLLGGCTRVGLPRSDPPIPSTSSEGRAAAGPEGKASAAPDGVYQGVLELEGGEMEAGLELRPTGGRTVRAILQLSSDWVAEGKGNRRGEEVRLELSYDSGCPGIMTLTGLWDPGLFRLTGEVQAADCTGQADGTFSFSPSRPIRWHRQELQRGVDVY